MAQIVDTGRSLTSSGSQTLSLPIVSAPNTLTLAEFGLSVAANGVVQLEGTVGFQTTLGVPNVIFRILRNGQQIFNIGASGLAVLAIQPVGISFQDRNVPAGYHSYTLTVSNNSLNTLLNLASITGPIEFSGISIG